MTVDTNMETLSKNMLQGNRAALARLISMIENRNPGVSNAMRVFFPHTGRASVIGITGPPGAGKSSLVDLLTFEFRQKQKRIGIVAIDPSSPFSGGAILGDRIRMQDHSSDPNVFIRSLGTRGKHGGLSQATKEVVMLLDAAGFDVVLVETAGVGQTELDIMQVAQTVVVVLVPESGDGIQVMKAGLMEIADIFAVNKSDRPQADQLVKELMNMIGLVETAGSWGIPVIRTQANLRKGPNGVSELCDGIESHRAHLQKSGLLAERVIRFLESEIRDIIQEKTNASLDAAFGQPHVVELFKRMQKKELDPYSVATQIHF